MLGNVWELGCDDENFTSSLVFGGAWNSPYHRISIDGYGIDSCYPYKISNNVGFRIVRTYKSLK